MITIRTNEFETIKKTRDILMKRGEELSDDEFKTLVDLEYIIAKVLATSDKQIKNTLACRKYRQKHRKRTSEYNHNYYINNVKPKRKEQ